ncbi:MAG: hypothetical protein ACM3SU_11855 [Acidobacteriota bacterium]
MKPLRLVPFALALLAVVSCGKDNSAPTQPAMTTPPPGATPTPSASMHTVDVGPGGANAFSDSQSHSSTTTVRAGDTVQWVWSGSVHSATSGACCTGNGAWDSGVKSSGTFSHTFSSAGSFPYFCTVHGSLMTGMVIVNP